MRVDYHEGDWFAVPLATAGYGVGLVARTQPARDGVMLGYFFGVKYVAVPSLADVSAFRPEDAVMVRRLSHLEIIRGGWPIIGRKNNWSRNTWPMPIFVRRPSLGPSMLVTYADDDPARIVSSVKMGEASPDGTAPEGLLGATLLVSILTKKL